MTHKQEWSCFLLFSQGSDSIHVCMHPHPTTRECLELWYTFVQLHCLQLWKSGSDLFYIIQTTSIHRTVHFTGLQEARERPKKRAYVCACMRKGKDRINWSVIRKVADCQRVVISKASCSSGQSGDKNSWNQGGGMSAGNAFRREPTWTT